MPLHVDLIAHAARELLSTEEVVHPNLPHIAHGGEGADVAADAGGPLVAIADHNRGVPTNQVGDALLQGEVTWILGLHPLRDRVEHGRCNRWRNLDALAHSLVHNLVDQEACLQGAVVLNHSVDGLRPLLRLVRIENGQVRLQRNEVRWVVAPVLVHERQRGRELRHLAPQGIREVGVRNLPGLARVEVLEEGVHFPAMQREPNLRHQLGELLGL
mmetsp:Transcript_121177/g.339348  ORF Transcript_121177/g.339348 Transcript_121177/m.339348 type:complete len:215 (+) Transcript_121177:2541-3185(+)